MGRIISVAALLAGAGCGSTFRLNGTYVGVRPFTVQPGQDSVVVKQLATVQLVAKPDGTAELSDASIPIEGHIEYGASDATFVPESIAGVGMYKQGKDLVDKYTVKLVPKSNDEWVYGGSLVLKRREDHGSAQR